EGIGPLGNRICPSICSTVSTEVSRLGPIVPVVPAAAKVWHSPQPASANTVAPSAGPPPPGSGPVVAGAAVAGAGLVASAAVVPLPPPPQPAAARASAKPRASRWRPRSTGGTYPRDTHSARAGPDARRVVAVSDRPPGQPRRLNRGKERRDAEQGRGEGAR